MDKTVSRTTFEYIMRMRTLNAIQHDKIMTILPELACVLPTDLLKWNPYNNLELLSDIREDRMHTIALIIEDELDYIELQGTEYSNAFDKEMYLHMYMNELADDIVKTVIGIPSMMIGIKGDDKIKQHWYECGDTFRVNITEDDLKNVLTGYDRKFAGTDNERDMSSFIFDYKMTIEMINGFHECLQSNMMDANEIASKMRMPSFINERLESTYNGSDDNNNRKDNGNSEPSREHGTTSKTMSLVNTMRGKRTCFMNTSGMIALMNDILDTLIPCDNKDNDKTLKDN